MHQSFNPYTASRRFITMLDKSEVTKQTPEKALVEAKKRSGGRNSHGEITSWHRGGAISAIPRRGFRREKRGIPARVAAIEYDPQSLRAAGAVALRGRGKALHSASHRPGSRHDRANRRRRRHSAGQCHAVAVHPAGHPGAQPGVGSGKGAQVVRAAGGAAQLLSKVETEALVKLPSGEVRRFGLDCMATVGQVGNLDHENVTYGKAAAPAGTARSPRFAVWL